MYRTILLNSRGRRIKCKLMIYIFPVPVKIGHLNMKIDRKGLNLILALSKV